MLDGASATSGYELGLGWRSDSDAVCDGPEEYCLAVDQRKNSYAHENCKIIKSPAFSEVSVVLVLLCLVPSVVSYEGNVVLVVSRDFSVLKW